MQGCTQYIVTHSELVEDQDGLFRQGEEHILTAEGEPSVAALFSSPEEGVSAWIRRMSGRGYRLEELPWCRRRGLGLVYSVVAGVGGDSLLYGVMVFEDASV